MIDRFFFTAVIIACSVAGILAVAEQAEVAARHAPHTVLPATAPQVVHLERVVITARRDGGTALALESDAASAATASRQ
jgi:hypothetical protein